jgi:hypothetical protein
MALGMAYLGVFNFWMRVGPPRVSSSGLGVAVFLAVLLMIAVRQRYFVNFWDALFHTSVILDIVLEASWIERHEHVGFYLCAAAFAVVLIGYRLWFVRCSGQEELIFNFSTGRKTVPPSRFAARRAHLIMAPALLERREKAHI